MRVRFCQQCKLNVYNISEMTIAEAEELIIGKEGRVCLRMYRRQDGTLISKDCPVGIAAAKRKLVALYGSVAAIASFAVMWVLNFGKQQQEPVAEMGRMKAVEAQTGGVSIRLPEQRGNAQHQVIMGDYAPLSNHNDSPVRQR